jgi:glycine cleavage system H protein
VSEVKQDLRYSESHEWFGGEPARVGITDHAQSRLGDVVYLELPEVGRQLTRGDVFGAIESVKAASDLYAPVTGTVSAVNRELLDHPEWVNQDPYGKGWMLEIERQNGMDGLLDADAYASLTEG